MVVHGPIFAPLLVTVCGPVCVPLPVAVCGPMWVVEEVDTMLCPIGPCYCAAATARFWELVFCIVTATDVCFIAVVALMFELVKLNTGCSEIFCSMLTLCWVSETTDKNDRSFRSQMCE